MTWLVSPSSETPYAAWHCMTCHESNVVGLATEVRDDDGLLLGLPDEAAWHVREHGHRVIVLRGKAVNLWPMSTVAPVPDEVWDNITKGLTE